MALLNAIARKIRRILQTPAGRRTTRVCSLRPEVEVMEKRALLTGVGTVFSDGILQIRGTSGDDNVAVEIRQNTGFGVNNDLVLVKSNNQVIASSYMNADCPSDGGNVLRQIIFNGGDGDDVFINYTWIGCLAWGEGGNDILAGGSGDDIMMGGEGCDYMVGREGNDRLLGDKGDDVLVGGSGDDRLDGGLGDDVLFGGYGNDHLFGDWGIDRLYGGSGDDALIDFDFAHREQEGPNSST